MNQKTMLSYLGVVTMNECDSNNHMNVMYYIHKYEQAASFFLLKVGFTKTLVVENNWGIVVLEQNIRYLKEAFEGDVLYIETQLNDISRKVITLKHEMKNEETDDLLGLAIMKYAILNKVHRKTVLLPDSITSNLKIYPF